MNYVDGVLGRCGVCRASDKAPHLPIPGTSTVLTFNGNLQVDLFLPGDLKALRPMDLYPTHSLSMPARPKNPQEVRDSFRSARVGVFRQPKSVQTGEGGDWKNDVWADLCSGRRTKLQFHEVGARPRILERRNCLSRST